MIDFHVHTTASDGQYTPGEIVKKAAEKGISVLAITDHDTLSGLEEAKKEAKNHDITLIPGVELNINRPNCEFHLLGLGFKRISPSLTALLNGLVNNRDLRNEQIIKKIQEAGIEISMEEIHADFPDTVIGRPHIAAELVKKKVVKNPQQAFDKYLIRGKPWYVDKIGVNLDEAILAINESGGIPVIAHPMSLYVSWGKMPEVLQDFYDRGIQGLEAFHPGARVTECLRLEELARKIGYFITGGSDFHGEKVRADRKLGHTCGGKKLEDRLWFEELGPALGMIQKS